MKLYHGILTRLDGNPITQRTKVSTITGYWTSNPDLFQNGNKAPMRMFIYTNEPSECESPGVSMEINALEKMNNTYRFSDYSNVKYEFILEKIEDNDDTKWKTFASFIIFWV